MSYTAAVIRAFRTQPSGFMRVKDAYPELILAAAPGSAATVATAPVLAVIGGACGALGGAGVGGGLSLAEAGAVRAALITAVLCGVAGLALTLTGRPLVGCTIHVIANAADGSRATLAPLGKLIGEPEFGPVSRSIFAFGEGTLFGLGLAYGLMRRPHGERTFPSIAPDLTDISRHPHLRVKTPTGCPAILSRPMLQETLVTRSSLDSRWRDPVRPVSGAAIARKLTPPCARSRQSCASVPISLSSGQQGAVASGVWQEPVDGGRGRWNGWGFRRHIHTPAVHDTDDLGRASVSGFRGVTTMPADVESVARPPPGHRRARAAWRVRGRQPAAPRCSV